MKTSGGGVKHLEILLLLFFLFLPSLCSKCKVFMFSPWLITEKWVGGGEKGREEKRKEFSLEKHGSFPRIGSIPESQWGASSLGKESSSKPSSVPVPAHAFLPCFYPQEWLSCMLSSKRAWRVYPINPFPFAALGAGAGRNNWTELALNHYNCFFLLFSMVSINKNDNKNAPALKCFRCLICAHSSLSFIDA